MSNRRSGKALPPLLGLVALVIWGCTDTESVFETEPPWNVPTAAQGFLGYGSAGGSTPFCEACHPEKSAEWSETDHAEAWADLQGSGEAVEECEGCHTAGARGNWVRDENVAWAATGDPRYVDVQCESCHGPGLDHLYKPEAYQPLASVDVGRDLENGCGECHTGPAYPFVDEWDRSSHARRNTFPQGRGGSCAACHEMRGVFADWSVDTNYLEKDGTEPLPLVCVVCHDPHLGTAASQLRLPIDAREFDLNLCMRCHQRRAVPDEEASGAGPHSPEGPLLLGEAGWFPPVMDYEPGELVPTHGSERNQDLCVTCHMPGIEVTDPGSGDLEFRDTGHVFEAIPCVDEAGIPTGADSCDLEERTFAACVASGCHSLESTAREFLVRARARTQNLADELDALLDQLPDDEFDSSDGIYTTAEGALFNRKLALRVGSPVHNSIFIQRLLEASIEQVELDYEFPAP